jgi:multimeric flavodoxin WrbA
MEVAAFCGSARKQENTYLLQKAVFEPLVDAILLGSPAYFGDVTSEMKTLIDHCGMVSRANGHMFQRKIETAVVVVRRSGAVHTLGTMNHFPC